MNSKTNAKIASADIIKKLKNGLKIDIYKKEEKGKQEIKDLEKDGDIKATIESKDEKILSTLSDMDFQKNKDLNSKKDSKENKMFKQKLIQIISKLKKNDILEMHEDNNSHMAHQQLKSIFYYLTKIKEKFNPEKDLPDWVDAKITSAAEKLAAVAHYIEAFEQKDNNKDYLFKAVPKGIDKDKYESCVRQVKKKNKKYNPWAVCAASLKKMQEIAKANRCWSGYKPVKGKAPYSKGSCEKIKKAKNISVLD